jgi:hypothetical protein
METSVPTLKQQPLLRVHRLGFGCRHTKGDARKALRTSNEATMLCTRELR